MNAKRILTAVAAFVLLLLANSAFYTLNEIEQAIITQFGSPVGAPVKSAGLHMKLPFIQKVTVFDKRLLEWQGNANQIPTEDKKYVWVSTFARWHIKDPLKFFQSVNNERNAQSRLDDIIDGVTRDVISKHPLIEIVRNTNREMITVEEGAREGEVATVGIEDMEPITKGRAAITKLILERARETVPQYGIELVDVRLHHIDYIEEVRRKVYERMISERNRIAEKYRSEGQGERAKIEGQREKELQRIQSEAYRTAQKLKGEADAKATKIYAEAYGRDPEFYSFLQTLESYRNTLQGNSTMFLKTDAEFLKYLKSTQGR
jgi:membrane protease subunit HflC